jgi:4-amino-4-deoxy-L-arabinose transferase-like glycosyltransferase
MKFKLSLKKLSYNFVFILIVLFAFYLRMINLEANPGWYSDEGTQIEIAHNLMNGDIQYFSINQSTLLVARMPLFSLLLAAIFKVFGVGILQLRIFTAILGISTITTLYFVVSSILGNKSGLFPLLTAFIFSIYPSAIIYHRLGFSYNLLSLFVLFVFLGLWKYSTNENIYSLFISSFFLGLACVVDITGVSFIPFALILVLLKDYRKLPIYTILALFPFIVYATFMLIKSPNAFIFDFLFTFSRVDNVSLIEQFLNVLANYLALILKDKWIIFGFLGFFVMENKKFGLFSFFFILFPMIFTSRVSSITGLSYYYFIPLFSFIVIGISSFTLFFLKVITNSFEIFFTSILTKIDSIIHLLDQKKRFRFSKLLSAFLLSGFIVPLLLFIIYQDSFYSSNFLLTTMNHVMVNSDVGKKATDFVNNNVDAEDLVIASPALAWRINSKIADFQVSLAYLQKSTMHLPGNIPLDRFEYNSDYKNAKFIIIDNIWTNWAIKESTEVKKIVEETQQWPLIWNQNEVFIYQNPIFNTK